MEVKKHFWAIITGVHTSLCNDLLKMSQNFKFQSTNSSHAYYENEMLQSEVFCDFASYYNTMPSPSDEKAADDLNEHSTPSNCLRKDLKFHKIWRSSCYQLKKMRSQWQCTKL